GVLFSFGLESSMDRRVIMIGEPQEADTYIQWVANEMALLEAMITWFSEFDPDIFIGWNVIDFDFRLLHKRSEWNEV
ncbi:3'-5' exonuclease, partial [Vibrio echinoideorum]